MIEITIRQAKFFFSYVKKNRLENGSEIFE